MIFALLINSCSKTPLQRSCPVRVQQCRIGEQHGACMCACPDVRCHLVNIHCLLLNICIVVKGTSLLCRYLNMALLVQVFVEFVKGPVFWLWQFLSSVNYLVASHPGTSCCPCTSSQLPSFRQPLDPLPLHPLTASLRHPPGLLALHQLAAAPPSHHYIVLLPQRFPISAPLSAIII